MRPTTFAITLAISLLAAITLSAQQPNDERQELAFTLGVLSGSNPGATAGTLSLGSGEALQANFARKIRDYSWGGSVYWEVNGLVNPYRGLSGTPLAATHNIWSLYVTPGVKLQFTPKEKMSPWLAGGGGYALYGESKNSLGAGPAGVSGRTNRGVVDLGGGFDFDLGKSYLLRGEARGFYTGGPNFGVNTPGGQFNFVIGGGIVLRFSR